MDTAKASHRTAFCYLRSVHKHDGEHKDTSAKAGRAGGLSRRLQRKALLAAWAEWDWSKSNAELADERGLSRERLRQIRQLVGAPKPAHRRHRMRKAAKVMQWAKDNLDKLKGLSRVELVRKYGLCRWQGSALDQFLKPFLRDGRRKHRWDLMNFRLPNRDLERIWETPSKMVGSYRFRFRLPRSTWCLRRGPGGTRFSVREQLQAYRRAVQAEERKAARLKLESHSGFSRTNVTEPA